MIKITIYIIAGLVFSLPLMTTARVAAEENVPVIPYAERLSFYKQYGVAWANATAHQREEFQKKWKKDQEALEKEQETLNKRLEKERETLSQKKEREAKEIEKRREARKKAEQKDQERWDKAKTEAQNEKKRLKRWMDKNARR